MGALGGGEEAAPRWLLQRGASVRGQWPNAAGSPRVAQASSPAQQSCGDLGFLSPGSDSKAESGPLVAWPEDGGDPSSLVLQLLHTRKATAAAANGSVEPSCGSASAPNTALPARVQSDSRFAGPAFVVDATSVPSAVAASLAVDSLSSSYWRAAAPGSPKREPDPDSLASGEHRRRAASLRLEWLRPESARVSSQRPQSPSLNSPGHAPSPFPGASPDPATGHPAPNSAGLGSRLPGSRTSKRMRPGGLSPSLPDSPPPCGMTTTTTTTRIVAGSDAVPPGLLQLSSPALARPQELPQLEASAARVAHGSSGGGGGGDGGNGRSGTPTCSPATASQRPQATASATTAALAAVVAIRAGDGAREQQQQAQEEQEGEETSSAAATAAAAAVAAAMAARGSGSPSSCPDQRSSGTRGPDTGPELGPPAEAPGGAVGGLKGQRGNYWSVGPLSSPARGDAASGSDAPLPTGPGLHARQQQLGRHAFLSGTAMAAVVAAEGPGAGPCATHGSGEGAGLGCGGTAPQREGRVAAPVPARPPAELTTTVKVAPAPAPVPVRHPPAVRVAIGLLPTPLQSPLAPSVGSPGTTGATSTAPSPCSALSQMLASTSRSKSGAPQASSPQASSPSTPPPPQLSAMPTPQAPAPQASSPSTPASVHGSLRPSSPSLPQHLPASPLQTAPTHSVIQSPPSLQLPGLPSFLGSPVVLDPPPPHVLPGGPGAPAPGLGPTLSRSASGADRSLSASASLSALHAVPPAQSPCQGPPPEGSLSSTSFVRSRGANSSRRSINGRNSFHRSGSYFRVREALPEAVLDNLPSVQAARGLPPQPQHPGAVPDEWPPPPPSSVASGMVSVASVGAGGAAGLHGMGHVTGPLQPHLSSGGSNSMLRRQGLDLLSTPFISAASPGFVQKLGHVASNGSSPQSTVSGGACGGGGATGTTSPGDAQPPTHGGPLVGHASWLRRAEAMPPVDMLPIQPSPQPLAMDHLQPASALSNLTPRLDGASRGGAVGGGDGGLSSSDGLSTEQLPDVPSAAAMAAAAVASYSLASEDDLASAPQLSSPSHRSLMGCGGDSRRASQELPPPPPAPLPPRMTFRTQSKLRLMNPGTLGLGGGDSTPAAAAASLSEQEALLALLGSSRMLSSVLTATSSPSTAASLAFPQATDPAVHGVRDPRYDHSAHIAVIPEHTVPTEPAAAAAAAAVTSPALLGQTRMGSTVFSPPSPMLSKLASSLRRPQRSRSGAGWSLREATRSAMPDMQLLSRRVGATSVVGPNGRTIHLVAKPVSASEAQLELPPPEELVSAVNGHALPYGPCSGAGSRSWGRGMTASLPNSAGGPYGGLGGVGESLTPVVGSSDESEEPPLRDAVRVSRSLKALASAVMGDLPGPRTSGSGTGRPGSSGVVPTLIRHLSAPARRLTLTSNSGLAPAPQPSPLPAAGPAAVAVSGSPASSRTARGRALGHKPSIISEGLRFLQRAFTITSNAAGERSWHSHSAAVVAAADGRRSPFGVLQPSRPASDRNPHGRGKVGFGADSESHGGGGISHQDSGTSANSSGGGSVGPIASRRRLLASQRSFLKHSAVLGWVQPGGPEDEASAVRTSSGAMAGVGSAADSDGERASAGSPLAYTNRTLTSSGAARLHSLQSLIATGGGQLTCDAVVAFSAGDGGTGNGGEGAAAVRRRRAAHGRGHYCRRGGGVPLGSDDVSDDARCSGYSGLMMTGNGAAPSTGGGGGGGCGAGWLAPSAPTSADTGAGTPGQPSPINATAVAVSALARGTGGDASAAGSPSSSGQCLPHQHQHSPQQPSRGFGTLGSPTSPGGGPPSHGSDLAGSCSHPYPHTHTLLGRIGSKLGRSMRRGSLVFPLQAGDLDRETTETSGTLSQELEVGLA